MSPPPTLADFAAALGALPQEEQWQALHRAWNWATAALWLGAPERPWRRLQAELETVSSYLMVASLVTP